MEIISRVPFKLGGDDMDWYEVIMEHADIPEFINDIKSYKDYIIKHYNGNVERATDKYSVNEFLYHYEIAINIFGLHPEIKRKLNQALSLSRDIVAHYDTIRDMIDQ